MKVVPEPAPRDRATPLNYWIALGVVTSISLTAVVYQRSTIDRYYTTIAHQEDTIFALRRRLAEDRCPPPPDCFAELEAVRPGCDSADCKPFTDPLNAECERWLRGCDDHGGWVQDHPGYIADNAACEACFLRHCGHQGVVDD